MAVRNSKQSAGIVATIFTSLVAPTLVALFTTAIKDGAGPVAVPANSPADTITSGSPPSVTLLPPMPEERQQVVIRSAYRWQPVNSPAAPMASRVPSPR
jgi:hypothetical protein